jgi:3-deoxy-D-manno-octulosonic-acid transferase
LSAERVRACGNLKFDNVNLLARETAALQARRRLGFGATDPVVVAGSTHPGEEILICEAIAALRRTIPNLRLVLAPRHLERLLEVLTLARACGRVGLLTRAPDPGGAEVVVVDTMGELAALYALADVAFVGGTLVPVGGHNLLEPAAYGVPILTGPHTATVQAQREELVREGAMCVMELSSAGECEKMIHSILSDPDSARRARAGAAHLFAANAGSLPRTMQALATVLPTKEPFHHG